MNSYNGYEPKQRYKALAWLKKEWAAGTRQQTPTCCDICGQTKGHLEYHSEDYSSPFGDHIGAFGLCYICHMMLHCRFRNKKAWDIYLHALENKKCFKPFETRNWIVFKRECLIKNFKDMKFKVVKTNNLKLYQDMSKGLYANSAKVSQSKVVSSLF